MRQLLSLAVISVASCFTDGGSTGCTEIGCTEGLGVIIHPAGSSFPPGDYQIEATLDGTANVCTFTIDSAGAVANQQCDVFFLALTASNLLMIGYPAAATLDLSIRIDDVEVHADQITPSYTQFAPNGEDCPPTCAQAEIDVQL
jgi:hypothetical protein